jgi:hypothetical protein
MQVTEPALQRPELLALLILVVAAAVAAFVVTRFLKFRGATLAVAAL